MAGEWYHILYSNWSTGSGPPRCASPTPTGRASWSDTTARASSAGSSGKAVVRRGDPDLRRRASRSATSTTCDDVVDAFLRAGGDATRPTARSINLGGDAPSRLCSDLVHAPARRRGRRQLHARPVPPGAQEASTSATSTPTSAGRRALLGWAPTDPCCAGTRGDDRLLQTEPGTLRSDDTTLGSVPTRARRLHESVTGCGLSGFPDTRCVRTHRRFRKRGFRHGPKGR